MTLDIKELVRKIRAAEWHGDDDEIASLPTEAADALEALEGQRDRFVERFNEARLALQAAENERDRLAGDLSVMRLKLEAKLSTEQAEEVTRLKAALVKMSEFHHSTSEKVAIARKALGGDAS